MGGTHKLSYQLIDNSINIVLHHPEDEHIQTLKLNISANDHHDHHIFIPVSDIQLYQPVKHLIFKKTLGCSRRKFGR